VDANLRAAQRMPGAGLTCVARGKALSDMPTFQPYWGKLAVRNDRGGGGNGGIIRSPLSRHHLTRPNHNGPESCGAAREGGVEASAGGRTGRVLSREINALPRKRQVLRDADAVEKDGRQHWVRRHRKAYLDPARSETPCTYASTLYGNREIPRLSAAERTVDRVGKPKGVRR
jgi:hypothetical protein